MSKTALIYSLIVVIFVLRLFLYCWPEFLSCADTKPEPKKEGDLLSSFRQYTMEQTHKYLPSPHSELLLGMVVGIDDFKNLPIFSKLLRTTGTVHVVVVSGYNVTLVFTFVFAIIGSLYKRRNFIIALVCTFFYALISGFEPPVVRAWFMGSILMLGKFRGLRLNTLLVLIFTGLLLLIIDPAYFFSLSFLLSFMATLSLVLFDGLNLDCGLKGASANLMQDLSSTLSAQVLVWPIISYFFGTVSLVSPLINMLVLWTVPLTTVLGSFFVLAALLKITFVMKVLAQIVYFPLDIFVRSVEFFSKIPYASVDLKLNLTLVLIYYLALAVYLFRKSK